MKTYELQQNLKKLLRAYTGKLVLYAECGTTLEIERKNKDGTLCTIYRADTSYDAFFGGSDSWFVHDRDPYRIAKILALIDSISPNMIQDQFIIGSTSILEDDIEPRKVSNM